MNCKGLLKRLTDPIEAFASLGDTTHTAHGPLTYIDRGSNVLAVAHLDWVKFNPNPVIRKQYQNIRISKCPQLDDRLGAWMMLDVLPRAGITCDVLLTDSEESGNSTAESFNPPKKYNWIMELDRAGSDVVMYDYEDKEVRDLMREYEYKVGVGVFTDICELQDLGCKAFNFGVGYHNQHTDECYANLSETFDSFRKVQEFYEHWKDEHFPHTKVETYSNWSYGGISNLGYNWRGNTLTKTEPIIAKAEPIITFSTLKDGSDWELDTIALEYYAKDYKWLNSKEKEEVDREYDERYDLGIYEERSEG
jgi:hypothetical protein